MADFNIADKDRAKNEGLYANNPADKGGETYAGISRRYWPSWKGWAIIDRIKRMHSSTTSTVNKYASSDTELNGLIEEFYKVNFWYALDLQNFKDQQLANTVYDFAVNAGTDTSARKLQNAANTLGAGLLVDGQIGVKTVAKVNSMNAKALHEAFNGLRLTYYMALVAKDPSQKQFLNSWKSRLKPYIS